MGGTHWGRRGAFVSVLVALVVAVFATPAFADNGTSANDQYEPGTPVKPVDSSPSDQGPTTVDVAGASDTGPAASGDELPVTGLSLIGLVVIGGALVATGLMLRRRGHGES